MNNEVRLIDANALWKNIAQNSGCPDCLCNKGQMTVLGCIDEAPVIEAEPVRHGSLVNSDIPNYYEFTCCGVKVDKTVTLKFNYCPNCGAKMNGENQ